MVPTNEIIIFLELTFIILQLRVHGNTRLLSNNPGRHHEEQGKEHQQLSHGMMIRLSFLNCISGKPDDTFISLAEEGGASELCSAYADIKKCVYKLPFVTLHTRDQCFVMDIARSIPSQHWAFRSEMNV
jgi:hypothetical protein